MKRGVLHYDRNSGTTAFDGQELFTADTSQLIEQIDDLRKTGRPELVVTQNVDQTLNLSDPAFREAYENASLRTIDGMPLVFLARLLGAKNVHRNTGADLLPAVSAAANQRGWSIVIAGGDPDTADRAVRKLQEVNLGVSMSSVNVPFLRNVDSPKSREVISRLGDLSPDIVFLCLGSPKQEVWFSRWRDELPAAVYVGAGAAVDFAAEQKRRAPVLMQKAGGEWLWRTLQEPRRLAGRYLIKGPRFLAVVFASLADTIRRPSKSSA